MLFRKIYIYVIYIKYIMKQVVILLMGKFYNKISNYMYIFGKEIYK